MIKYKILVIVSIMMMPFVMQSRPASQSDEIQIDELRRNANEGVSMSSGYEFEMALWAYYCINGADGICIDYAEAVRVLKKLVERDKTVVSFDQFPYVVEGYNLLGDCYEKGMGVNKNHTTAMYWWQRAADNDHAIAQEKLTQQSRPSIVGSTTSSNERIVISLPGSSLSFNMIYVEGGDFFMGAQKNSSRRANYDADAEPRESPVHTVEIGSFYIGEVEVTQELWELIMRYNNSENIGKNRPVENVSYHEAMTFCEVLSNVTGYNFTLPTEAQWEYAARGGKKSRGYKYAGSNNIDKVAWSAENSYGTSHDVAQKQPNELGIYDMSGNVWEWCHDWSQDWAKSYSVAPRRNPRGDRNGTMRIFRGGSWNFGGHRCRVSDRRRDAPSKSFKGGGLRVIMLP